MACTHPRASVCTRKSRNFQPRFLIFSFSHNASSTSDEYIASCTVFHSCLLSVKSLYLLQSCVHTQPAHQPQSALGGEQSSPAQKFKKRKRHWPEPRTTTRSSAMHENNTRA